MAPVPALLRNLRYGGSAVDQQQVGRFLQPDRLQRLKKIIAGLFFENPMEMIGTHTMQAAERFKVNRRIDIGVHVIECIIDDSGMGLEGIALHHSIIARSANFFARKVEDKKSRTPYYTS